MDKTGESLTLWFEGSVSYYKSPPRVGLQIGWLILSAEYEYILCTWPYISLMKYLLGAAQCKHAWNPGLGFVRRWLSYYHRFAGSLGVVTECEKCLVQAELIRMLLYFRRAQRKLLQCSKDIQRRLQESFIIQEK